MKIGLQDFSLGLKFVMLVAVVVSITMSSSTYYAISLETEKHTKDFEDKGELLADVVSLVSPEAIYAFDFFALNENVKEISLRKNVVYCAIKDQQGKFITSFLNSEDPIIKRNIDRSNSMDLENVLPLVDAEENIITIKKEIVYDGENLGEVYVGMSTQEIIEYYNQSVGRNLILTASVILLLSFMIFYIFKQSALNRIHELILCSEAVAEGNLNQKVKIRSNDELSKLGLAFNEMIVKLKSSLGLKELALNQIKELNKTLENKVQQRTEELETINTELSYQQSELKHHRDNLQDLVREQMEDIIKEKEKVEIASAAKTEFLTNMSHELRTPLHAILSFSKFGLKKVDIASVEIVKGYFEKIEKSGNRLLDLVNDLLDLAKLESGKLELKFINNDLVDIFSQVNSEFEVLLKEKDITLKLDCNEESVFLECDRQKIEQVVRNMMSNAVKFSTEHSQIFVEIMDLEDSVKLSVADQGVGIPENELTEVFDKFIQSSKTKDGAGGTGLGLPISKQIVDLHNGEIVAENVLNSGARFWFILPKKRS